MKSMNIPSIFLLDLLELHEMNVSEKNEVVGGNNFIFFDPSDFFPFSYNPLDPNSILLV